MEKQENSQIVETAKEARGAELGPTVRKRAGMVPGSLFNIAQLLKYMELGQCYLSGPAASFEKI